MLSFIKTFVSETHGEILAIAGQESEGHPAVTQYLILHPVHGRLIFLGMFPTQEEHDYAFNNLERGTLELAIDSVIVELKKQEGAVALATLDGEKVH